ncbi:MAG: phosphoenolpyruvate carboxylase, partial [Thiothrix sp.]|nr:phosphoenolpyruvate carboxylase [Thiothrix sp.]
MKTIHNFAAPYEPAHLQHLEERVRDVGDLLGETLREQEDEALYQAVEKLRRGYIQLRQGEDTALRNELMQFILNLDLPVLEKVIRAFNTFYVLSNIVEEEFRERERRTRFTRDDEALLWRG